MKQRGGGARPRGQHLKGFRYDEAAGLAYFSVYLSGSGGELRHRATVEAVATKPGQPADLRIAHVPIDGGPALAREPVLVRTGPVQTTHPQPGRVAPPVPPPPEAIRALLGQLRDLPTQAPSDLDDLEQARGRIAELERALRERPVEVRTETVVERVEVPAIDAGTLQRVELLVATLMDTGAELVSVGDVLQYFAGERHRARLNFIGTEKRHEHVGHSPV